MTDNANFISEFFKGLKVVELATVLAGPSAGMFLAELGADVVKIENKKNGGDVTRNWRIPGESEKGPSAYFSSINYKKNHVFLDLSNERDLDECKNFISAADVIISNFSERVSKKLSVDLESIKKINPSVIFVQLNGFYESNRPAYDVVLQAETGWIYMTGTKDNPAKLPVALIDVMAGNQIKEAVLLGMINKLRTNKGSYFEANLEQVSLSALANQATNYLMNRSVAAPIGTQHPNIAPYGDWFETRDGQRLVLAIGSEKQFDDFCTILDIAKTDTISTNTKRVENREFLVGLIQKKMDEIEYQNLADQLNDKIIPFGKIKSMDEVLESEAARTMIREELHDGRETKRLSTLGFTGGSF